jgi:membrane-associated phospholipid phosphatase
VDRRTRAALLAGASLAVGALSSTARGRDADASAFRALNRGRGAGPDAAFSSLTELGSLWAAGSAAAVLAVAGDRRAATRAGLASLGTWLAGQALKRAVDRSRPYDADPERTRLMIGRPRGTSWPSSHPAVLISFATVAGRDLVLGRRARRALTALSASVAASRVYLGVHYPSDVASGLLLGAAIADLFPPDRR